VMVVIFLGNGAGRREDEDEKFSWNFDCRGGLLRAWDDSGTFGGAFSKDESIAVDEIVSVDLGGVSVDDCELLRLTINGLFFFPAVEATNPWPFLLLGPEAFFSTFEL
jgi:hypothetical protein